MQNLQTNNKKQYSDAVRRRYWLQRLVKYERDFEDSKPGDWFSDNHITYLIENIQQSLGESSEEIQNFLFIKPIVVHWIKTKDSKEKDCAEKDRTLISFELGKKHLIFMPVCKENK